MNILTVGVVTLPFLYEAPSRMRRAHEGLEELRKHVDTIIVIPNQNLFKIANEQTTYKESFQLSNSILRHGVPECNRFDGKRWFGKFRFCRC